MNSQPSNRVFEWQRGSGRSDRAGAILSGISALIVTGIFLLIAGYLVVAGLHYFNWALLTGTHDSSNGSIAAALLGSLQLLGIASAVGLPIGVAAGVYLTESERGLFRRTGEFAVNGLADVPPVIVGLFAFAAFTAVGGPSQIAGALSLALIVIPIVATSTMQALNRVPNQLRDGALALGASRRQVFTSVTMPAAAREVFSGVLLAIARVAGETAPLLFVFYGVRLFGLNGARPVMSLPLIIFSDAVSPGKLVTEQVWTAAILLVTLVLTVKITSRILDRNRA